MKSKWNRRWILFLLRSFAAFSLFPVLLLPGTGCAHERTVVRHNPSSISFGVKGGAAHESGRPRSKDRKRASYNPAGKQRRPLKNPVPGLENPSGKPQDMNMDSLRSILTGSPARSSGGAASGTPAAPPAESAGTKGNAPAPSSVPQMRSVPLPTR